MSRCSTPAPQAAPAEPGTAQPLEGFPSPSTDPGWLFEVEGFDPFGEREVETWLTVANGETGTRGSLEEGSPASTPATLVAGVYGDDTGGSSTSASRSAHPTGSACSSWLKACR